MWKCLDCGAWTMDPKTAGDHEREYNDGQLAPNSLPGNHYMDDIGE